MSSLEEERVVATAGASPLRWLGLAIALVISGLGVGLGIWQHVPAQQIIFYAVITFALVAWIWNYYTGGRNKAAVAAAEYDADGNPVVRSGRAVFWAFVARNRAVLIGLALLLLAFGAASITIDGFFSLLNAISFLVLAALLILTAVMTKFVVENKSAFIGLTVLVALIVVGSLKVDGFVSAENIKSMLLFASFLGLACVGQTLVALLGGLDLSIPFVIGAANVGLLFLMGLGLPSWLAVILILLAGILVGLVSGFLSFWLQGQALILTLGVGFAVSGLTQILTSIGTRYSRQRIWLGAWLAHQSRSDERHHIRSRFSACHPDLGGGGGPAHLRYEERGLRTLCLCLGRQQDVGAAVVDLGAALLGGGLRHQRRRVGDDRSAAAGLERRRIHRGGAAVSVHDFGGGRRRRHVDSGRGRRIRLYRHRRAGAAGADLFPGRYRPELRVAAIHFRPACRADGGALCALAAHPHAGLRLNRRGPGHRQGSGE